jgi:hypothetical protein
MLSSQSLTFPNALTSTLLCYKSNDPLSNNTVPKARILSQALTELNFPTVSADTVINRNPSFAAQLGDVFGCFDIAGFTFSQENVEFYVEVLETKATLFIESTSPNQIISDSGSNLTSFSQGNARLVRIIHAVVSDTLLMNSNPTVIDAIYSDQTISQVFTQTYSFPF